MITALAPLNFSAFRDYTAAGKRAFLAVFLSETEQTIISLSSINIAWAKPIDRLAPVAGRI